MGGYRYLKVYQLAVELDNQLLTLSEKFPSSEIYSLTNQLRRSAHSIVANIAEGYGRRFYPQEYARFLTFSQASAHESLDHIGKMLTLLIRKIRNQN